ncbi:transposase [Streptomyces avidinii]|uniref:transposase n=1 Tax=Streptomyces avidinii TaxID=1895 RepID=UPI003866E9D3
MFVRHDAGPVGADPSKRLVPDELRQPTAPLLPSFAARPQGGATAPCDERAVFTAVLYALTSGCAWRHLPPTFGTSPATAHRRFTVWTEAGLWRRLHRAVLGELGARGEVNWISPIVDAASVRTNGGIADRAEPGRSRQDEQQQGVLLCRTPGLAARARARRAHRAARHRVRRPPRAVPLEDRTVDRLALRLPPPHRPIRTKGFALPRLPRPGRRPDLLPEARETCHVRHPLGFISNLWH